MFPDNDPEQIEGLETGPEWSVPPVMAFLIGVPALGVVVLAILLLVAA